MVGFHRALSKTGFGLFVCATLAVMTVSCGKTSTPAFNEHGLETAHPDPESPGANTPPADDVNGESGTKYLVLDQATILRFNKGGILEFRVEVPAGTKIEIPTQYQVVNLDYRKSDGSIERSSTGFITPLEILSVPTESQAQFPAATIEALNGTGGGLFVTAAIVGQLQGVDGNFEILKPGAPGSGFQKNYEISGKPKFNFTKAIQKRFGKHVNAGVDPNAQSAATREKWKKIYTELVRAAIRTIATPKALIMIDKNLAIKRSIEFEEDGTVPLNGAWTIATQATAVRHGFPNVPCAETMSEFIREAYARAGYNVFDDFNDTKKNRLIWSSTAAVVNLSAALDKAGWIPWDTTLYRPIVGSILMNGAGLTPGHTYISAGSDGRFIVDNGAPQGRDLRVTSQKIIEMMYQTGVFFLPPGINPPKW